MNAFGLLAGVIALLVIGLGFPLVILSERRLGYLWWPYMLGLGALCLLASLFAAADWLSIVLGLLGTTLIWGSTEMKEQAVRAELGWFPFRANKIKPPFAARIAKWRAPHL